MTNARRSDVPGVCVHRVARRYSVPDTPNLGPSHGRKPLGKSLQGPLISAKNLVMRAHYFIICCLTSLIMWGAAFHASRDVYRLAHTSGAIPNLHIKATIKNIMS
jgi:hypothetical protein